MEPLFNSKKSILSYQALEDMPAKKQTLNYLKEDSSNEDILSLGQLFGQLAPENEPLKRVAIVQTTHFDI